MLIFLFGNLLGQKEHHWKSKKIQLTETHYQLDSLSIAPGTVAIKMEGKDVDSSWYELDVFTAVLNWKGALPVTLEVSYRTLGLNLAKSYSHKDSSVIQVRDTLGFIPFRYTSSNSDGDFFGGTSLNKNGSISRGVMFGNNQNLSVNSTLNLQLSGKLSEDIEILASISDDNIPIQPQGNTQQLQDFDQVFIQLFSEKWKITAGDFWMGKPQGYFMKYNKRAQGGAVDIFRKNSFAGLDSSSLSFRVGAAVSKGKFARNIIQGIENNQGPYRLQGADGEQFIVVLSGTEVIYIDGQLLTRGQENDYVIDYNTAEITFTANRLITKDKRIIAEFQYSDKNYARSIIEANTTARLNDWTVYFNVYSEQDSRNQPLQQALDDADREALFAAGDNLYLTQVPSIDSVGFDNSTNRYELKDSLGYQILQYATNAESGLYSAIFSDVGQGVGDYVQDGFSAFGKVYVWVAPDTAGGALVHNGRYAPVKLLIPPKKRQMVTAGVEKNIASGIRTTLELAYSNFDANTFSTLDGADDEGYAGRFKVNINKKLGSDWTLKSESKVEFTSTHFNYIERYREVEFTRNWNLGNLNTGNQILGDANLTLALKKVFTITYGFNTFQQEQDYSGVKNQMTLDLKKWVNLNYSGSYLTSKSDASSNFYRHIGALSKTIGPLKIGYEDEFENNEYFVGSALTSSSYQYYDYQFFLSGSDSLENKFKLFYRERRDQRTYLGNLLLATRAINPGGELQLIKNRQQQLIVRSNYRILEILDTSLVSNKPESGILNRVEHRGNFFKGGLTSTLFYEVGSGLELRKEFAYVEVPAGQGVYTWVDYNEDGVKDLNEFEIAQYPDQATYLRINIPANDYIKVFSNQISEVLGIHFRNLLKGEDGVSKFIKRFSSQTNLKLERRTTITDLWTNLNPFIGAPDDEYLQSVNNSLRQSTFFNRTNAKFGLEHTYLKLSSKSLLASGFDTREKESHEAKLRWNISRAITLLFSQEWEQKEVKADYVTGRDYELNNLNSSGKLSYQPKTAYRVAIVAAYKDKRNNPELQVANAYITEIGLEGKWNQLKKGTLTGNLKYAKIVYDGPTNTALAFEMLESLQPGDNLIGVLGYQRTFANNLQMTINYTGRKSEGVNMIHTGGLQLRAFF